MYVPATNLPPLHYLRVIAQTPGEMERPLFMKSFSRVNSPPAYSPLECRPHSYGWIILTMLGL